ncbi:hypothetical protein [Streptomyces sp. NPDC046759]|uniref:hypothetical protein n=1 Tax=Streptomyces sp. NPDC046759 TaxID=3155019 RepID=UPI0034095F75
MATDQAALCPAARSCTLPASLSPDRIEQLAALLTAAPDAARVTSHAPWAICCASPWRSTYGATAARTRCCSSSGSSAAGG